MTEDNRYIVIYSHNFKEISDFISTQLKNNGGSLAHRKLEGKLIEKYGLNPIGIHTISEINDSSYISLIFNSGEYRFEVENNITYQR